MRHSINELTNYKIKAKDGLIGYCKDVLFNDEDWTLHYLVSDTHKWLPGGHKALFNSRVLKDINREKKEIHVDLTLAEIEQSPALTSCSSIARAYEKTYMCLLDYAYYHIGPNPLDSYFSGVSPSDVQIVAAPEEPEPEKNHVHSAHYVEEYEIEASDHQTGHLIDFVLDDETWQIVEVAADVSHWLTNSPTVLIPPQWLAKVEWANSKVYIDHNAYQIEHCPKYDKSSLLVAS